MCNVCALSGFVSVEGCTPSVKPERGERAILEQWHLLQLCPVTDLNFSQSAPCFKQGAKGVK